MYKNVNWSAVFVIIYLSIVLLAALLLNASIALKAGLPFVVGYIAGLYDWQNKRWR